MRTKILILNGSLDREVGPSRDPCDALDFVEAIVRAGEEGRGSVWRGTARRDGGVAAAAAAAPGSAGCSPPIIIGPDGSTPRSIHASYITHLIYLSPPSSQNASQPAPPFPHVDPALLRRVGIEPIKLYGRKIEEVGPDGVTVLCTGMAYDPSALRGALEMVLGRRGAAVAEEGDADGSGVLVGRSRRNTLEA